MSNVQVQINDLSANIQALETSLTNVTGNTMSNYNQLSRIVANQGNIYNAVYYGSGNINTGNLTVNDDILHSGFTYNPFTVNNTAVTITPPISVPRMNFVSRFSVTAATTGTTYDLLRLSYSLSGAMIIIARVSGHFYFGVNTSSGIFQENRILIDINNTAADTTAGTVSNGTPIIATKGSSGSWTSCNMSVVLTTAGKTLIRVTPVFTGTQSLSASALTIDWTIISSKDSGTNSAIPQITSIDFYAGV